MLKEAVPVHDGHVPVKEDHVRHLCLAGLQPQFAVLGLSDTKGKAFHDVAGDFPDDPRVVNDQAITHKKNSCPSSSSACWGLRLRANGGLIDEVEILDQDFLDDLGSQALVNLLGRC